MQKSVWLQITVSTAGNETKICSSQKVQTNNCFSRSGIYIYVYIYIYIYIYIYMSVSQLSC